jgi:putative peptide modification system cyclase
MNGDNGTSTQAPQMRALLFTDLCDSLILVERIGDAAAAELFQQHDRLVLTLQQQWNGHQIDRSDGLFLLFDRAIDALGFALDYQQRLQALGQTLRVPLRVRAGLHVGEVILWNNSVEAVAHGAKPIEVEGLAKPMAARLMQVARPGQILVSSLAESIARRSSAELGEFAHELRWKSHGRWRFKGMSDPQEIWQVAATDSSTMRRPPSGKKAWLDRPLWLRPGALLAEMAACMLLAVVAWTLLRPEPAIAFAERDWVVIGDMRNLTGDTLLDDSLQQAFRISLEQSRYVNVLSDMKARGVLQLMQLDAGARMDANAASEVAMRTGARMVLLPTVAEVGGHTRISVEVVDPQSQETLSVATAEADGSASLLDSIDKITASLRQQLGEAAPQLRADSKPLPLVTTSSLDALRAYALGQNLYAGGDYEGALAMYEKAVRLDEGFALAWMGQVRARFTSMDNAGALAALKRVKALTTRLTPREVLYLDAWSASLTDQGRAASAWTQLASLYPDYFAAQHNAAMWLYVDNRFEEALPHAIKAADPRFELSTIAHDQLGRILLAMGDQPGARRAFEKAVTGGRSASQRYLAGVAASQRDYRRAEELLAKVSLNKYANIERTSLAADRRLWSQAEATARAGLKRMAGEVGYDQRLYLLPLATVQWAGDEPDAASKSIRATVGASVARLADPASVDTSDDAMVALGAALLALRMQDAATASRALVAVRARPELARQAPLNEMAHVVDAELARLRGAPETSLRMIEPFLGSTARFQTRVAAMKAYLALGRREDALRQARVLSSSRGLAYSELNCGYCLQPLNVIDSNEAGLVAAELTASAGAATVAAAPASARMVKGP